MHVTISSSQVHTRDSDAETLGRDPTGIIFDADRFAGRIICSLDFDSAEGNVLRNLLYGRVGGVKVFN